MEKYGTNETILYEDLRNEEAQLMVEVQGMVTFEKTASAEFRTKQARLQQVRNKLTELDLGKSN